MRARVCDGIKTVIVRKMGIARIAIEAELEDSDSRQLELITKGNDVRSDIAEVLGNERQMAKLCSDRFKKISAGAGDWRRAGNTLD